MKRKIVKLGPATLVVSLPSKWVRKINVKVGDEVELEERDDGLLISPERTSRTMKDNLEFIKPNRLMRRIVAAKYMKGADEIDIKVGSTAISREIQKRVDQMIGMEIVDQSKDKLLIKSLGISEEDNIETISKRILYLLQSISDESLNAIKNRETDLEYLKDMELNVNKFSEYCFRLLNKKGHPQPSKTASFYCSLFLLEELADEYKKLIDHINDNKVKLINKLTDIYAKINSYQKSMNKIFLKYNEEKALSLAKEYDIISKDIELELKKTKSVKEAIVLKTFENISHIIIKIMNEFMNIN
ncbi:MAG: AbrB/MazE/SpoVT family DNA-binding domain-containing protein [Nanoarchaeota archaeon]|nr:AbrB/MazE/SpoVT family DNA-binding domain-containing protein [Nanoarchaeota archaeon]